MYLYSYCDTLKCRISINQSWVIREETWMPYFVEDQIFWTRNNTRTRLFTNNVLQAVQRIRQSEVRRVSYGFRGWTLRGLTLGRQGILGDSRQRWSSDGGSDDQAKQRYKPHHFSIAQNQTF